MPPIKCLRCGWFHPWAPGREHGVPLFPGSRDREKEWCGRSGLAAGRVLWSGRDLPLYEPGGAGETLLGELAIAGLELDAEIGASGEGGCNERAAGAGEWIQHQIAGA